MHAQDFPSDTVDRNPPASAGDMNSIPGPGRSHMPQSNLAQMRQLLKYVCLEPVLHNRRSPCNEKPRHRKEE